MSRIVDLTLPVTSGMAGIPKIAFYEQYPTRIQAVTVVNEEQRAALAAEDVDVLPGAPAINSMNRVIVLNTHIGTHIDAPRHFYADGTSVSDIPLDRIVMRDAVVLDVSHKSADQGVTADDLERTGVKPGRGQIAVIKTSWTDRAYGKPEFLEQHHPSRAERRRVGRAAGRLRCRDGLLSGKAVLVDDVDASRARRQSQALAQGRHPHDPDAHQAQHHRA
jgi:hypothetical protein